MTDDSGGCTLDCLPLWQDGQTCPHGVKQTGIHHVPAAVRLNKSLASMWSKHGAGPDGRKCKDCVRCGYVQYSRRYYKCSAYGNTASAATDWRVNWPACGIFEAKT